MILTKKDLLRFVTNLELTICILGKLRFKDTYINRKKGKVPECRLATSPKCLTKLLHKIDPRLVVPTQYFSRFFAFTAKCSHSDIY